MPSEQRGYYHASTGQSEVLAGYWLGMSSGPRHSAINPPSLPFLRRALSPALSVQERKWGDQGDPVEGSTSAASVRGERTT